MKLSDDAQRQRDVRSIQRTLVRGTAAARAKLYTSNPPQRTLRAFFDTFDQGYTVSADVCGELGMRRWWTEQVPVTWILSDAIFVDDAQFNPARYYLSIVRRHQIGIKPGAWCDSALEQGKRMLAAGRVDPQYLNTKNLAPPGATGTFEVLLRAYLPEGTKALERLVAQYSADPAADTHPELRVQLKLHRAKIAAITAERRRLFHEVWLPAILPATEWAAVQHMPRGLLRDLHDDLWRQGYAAYSAAMRARTPTVPVGTSQVA